MSGCATGNRQRGGSDNGICSLLRDAVLFVLRPQNAVDGIRSAVAELVVMPYLHFAKQADSEQIQAPEQQAKRRKLS